MISWMSNWAEGIIVAVIIGTIIEMILPAGSSKKYIKMVIGVYVLFTIISPVISKFTGNSLAVSDILDLNQYINEVKEKEVGQNLQTDNEQTIRNIYVTNLKSDMKSKLQAKGYAVYSINIVVGKDENYTIEKVTLLLRKEDLEEKESEKNTDSIVETVNEVQIHIGEKNWVESETSEDEQTTSNLTSEDKSQIKEYISEIYEIKQENIIIP